MSKFKRFVEKLKSEGYSKESARKIAAVEGAKKYGWRGMEQRAQEARSNKE